MTGDRDQPSFEELLASRDAPGEAAEQPVERRTRGQRFSRTLLVVSVGAALVGTATIVGAVSLPPLFPSYVSQGERPAATPDTPGAEPQPLTGGEGPETVPEYPDIQATAGTDEGAEPGIVRRVDPGWASGVALSANIPERAMLAYAGAALRIAEENPSCNLGWNTLAGIGHVESGHGTIHDNGINDAGATVPGVFGPTLNVPDYDIVTDTDEGMLDGDAVWDRAVGPLQFLPSTWQLWGSDANGDGVADPQNIDDAALSAGYYLCDVGQDLAAPVNWLAAIRAYNDSNEYARAVSQAATFYSTSSRQPDATSP